MNTSTRQIRNPFTCRILEIKSAVKEVRSAKFYTILLASTILVAFFILSPAIPSLMNDVTASLMDVAPPWNASVMINSTGRIRAFMTADSGSAEDVQAAVDAVEAAGGDRVYIPEGTFNFYELGETWEPVIIPAGINVFGALTERTSGLPVPEYGRNPNDQVVEWKTVLVMPWEVPSERDGPWPTFFSIEGDSDPDENTRISDIKMVGYREIDNSSTTMYTGISIWNVVDFRIDHCAFINLAGSGVSIMGDKHAIISGVIDHSILWNVVGIPSPYDQRTVSYGISLRRGVGYGMQTIWEDDVSKIFGEYLANEYTTSVFIEDNVLYRWRHGVCSNDGFHYVARYNTIPEGNFGNNIFDIHGPYFDYPICGGRAAEIYNNRFERPIDTYARFCSFIRGGSALLFNNWVEWNGGDTGWMNFVWLRNDYPSGNERCWTKDTYIWGNEVNGMPSSEIVHPADPNVEYYEYPYTNDNPDYTPYPYPHPLTLQTYP